MPIVRDKRFRLRRDVFWKSTHKWERGIRSLPTLANQAGIPYNTVRYWVYPPKTRLHPVTDLISAKKFARAVGVHYKVLWEELL